MNGMKRLAAALRHNALLFEHADDTRAEEAGHGVVGIDPHKTSSLTCIPPERSCGSFLEFPN